MQLLKPLVSVIVPVYNAEAYVSETIKSVLNQSYAHWELILIDDGSVDQSCKIICSFLDDDRIHYFYQEQKGQGSARNLGIKKANGIYLAFLDADDVWDEHKLQTQITVIQEEDCCLVFSQLRMIGANSKYLSKNIGDGTGRYAGLTGFFLLANGSITIPNSSVLLKKESIEQVGGFNEEEKKRNIEDYELWFRLLLAGNAIFGINIVLGSYRIHENQMTTGNRGQNLKLIRCLEDFGRSYPDKKIFIQFLILQRLSMFYAEYHNKREAKLICLQKYFSSSCFNTYWFEKYLINFLTMNNYLKIRCLLIRRFRRFKTFVGLIDQ